MNPAIGIEVDELADTGNAEQEWEEYASTVSPAMDKLSVEQEEAIRLRYFAGLSYKEIGLLCKISIGRVKSRLHEARQILKIRIPDLLLEIDVPQTILIRNKEKIMRTLELIKKGAYVVRALDLETQLHLCRLAKDGTKFDEQLIEAIGKVKHGKDFVKGYQSRLMMEDLVWIFTFSRELQEWVIENLEEIDLGLAEDFKHRTFILEDIVLLDPEAVRKVLEKVPAETIVIAMLSCATEVKRYIMSFFPIARQQELLLKVPVLKTDHKALDAAQFEVLQVISQMAEEKVIRVDRVPDPNETIRMHLKMQNIE
jgi:predicted DNA-binding protein (UPF0251 family)